MNQSGFIKGRQIVDGVLIANELVAFLKRARRKAFVLKVDFEKAFDCVDWGFLISVMRNMGFGNTWCNWIHGCLSSASVSVLINGSPSREFLMKKGLRQGDPLSPFLFLIVAEALQVVVSKASDQGMFSGLKVDDSINISLLQYADDALLFGRWSKGNIRNIFRILKLFEHASGLKVNVEKSRLFGINVDITEVQNMAACFGCKAENLPFRYLGLPVGDSPSRSRFWIPVLESIERRLGVWKSKLISIGGRITLCKAVLDSLPVYFLSLFCLPAKVRNQIDKWRRRFLWGSKVDQCHINWVAWERITDCKRLGGLGLKNLELFNLGLLGKWKWRMLQDQGSLWIRIIKAIHGNSYDDVSRCLSLNKGSIWGNIVASWNKCAAKGVDLDNIFHKSVGNGRNTSFWRDCWGPFINPLCNSFPRLFALEVEKEAQVADRWNWAQNCWSGCWNWRIDPRGRAESEVKLLAQTLQPVCLKSNVADSWACSLESSGEFSVNKLYKKLVENKSRNYSVGLIHNWNAWIPSKVNVCIWRAIQDRLPSKTNLRKRGVDIPDDLCVFCGKVSESVDHLMFDCENAVRCWRKVMAWWSLEFNLERKWDILLNSPNGDRWTSQQKKGFHGVCCIVMWNLWKWRNSIVFLGEGDLREELSRDIFPLVQNLSLFWIKHRSGRAMSSVWNIWLSNPKAVFGLLDNE